MLEPRKLRSELEMRGLQVLSVGRHQGDSDVLVVYLHGNAGQWRDGAAQMLIASVPGVSRVIESAQSSSILLVTMARGV
jgi:hypothetical protein